MKKDLVDQKAKKDRVLRQSSKLLQEILSSSSKSVAGTQVDDVSLILMDDLQLMELYNCNNYNNYSVILK